MTESRTESHPSRVDIAIEKLTIISSNLDKLLSVHELRLNQQEKQMDQIEISIEKRREEHINNTTEIYDFIRNENKNTAIETEKWRKETAGVIKDLGDKVSKIEKSIWLYMGGLSVVMFLLTYGQSFIKLIQVASTK